MSERSFSSRRRGGMRFRPSGGMSAHPQRPDRSANEARAEALTDKAPPEEIFDRNRHQKEIDRAENIAAGLPEEATPPSESAPAAELQRKHDFREPRPDAPVNAHPESNFEPVPIKEPNQGLVGTIRNAATRVIRKVQKLKRIGKW